MPSTLPSPLHAYSQLSFLLHYHIFYSSFISNSSPHFTSSSSTNPFLFIVSFPGVSSFHLLFFSSNYTYSSSLYSSTVCSFLPPTPYSSSLHLLLPPSLFRSFLFQRVSGKHGAHKDIIRLTGFVSTERKREKKGERVERGSDGGMTKK